jgi:hypothetical protein
MQVFKGMQTFQLSYHRGDVKTLITDQNSFTIDPLTDINTLNLESSDFKYHADGLPF